MILTTGVNFLLNVRLLQQTVSPLPTLNSFRGLNKAGKQEGQGKEKRDCMERAAWQGLQLPQRKQPACANLTGRKPKRTHTGISLPPADLLLVAPRGRGNPSRSQRVTVSADAVLRHPHQPRAQSGGGGKRTWWGRKQQSSPTALVTKEALNSAWCLLYTQNVPFVLTPHIILRSEILKSNENHFRDHLLRQY